MRNFISRMKHNIIQYLLLFFTMIIVFSCLIVINADQVKSYSAYQDRQEVLKEMEKNSNKIRLINIVLDNQKVEELRKSMDDIEYTDYEQINLKLDVLYSLYDDYNDLPKDLLNNLKKSEYIERAVDTAYLMATAQGMFVVNKDGEKQEAIEGVDVKLKDGTIIEKSRFPNVLLFATDNENISKEFEIGYRKIVDGDKPTALNDCMISERYAKINGLKIGDAITLDKSGRGKLQSNTLKISGIYSNSIEVADSYDPYIFQLNSIYQPYQGYGESKKHNGLDNTIITSLKTIRQMSIYDGSDEELSNYFDDDGIYYGQYSGKEKTLFFMKDSTQLEELDKDFKKLGLSEYYNIELVEYNVKAEVQQFPIAKSPISANITYTIIAGLVAILFTSIFATFIEANALKLKLFHNIPKRALILHSIVDIGFISASAFGISLLVLSITENPLFQLRPEFVVFTFLGLSFFQVVTYILIKTIFVSVFKPSQYLSSEIKGVKKEKLQVVNKIISKNTKITFFVVLIVSVGLIGISTTFGNLETAGSIKKAYVKNGNQAFKHPYTTASGIFKSTLVSIYPNDKMVVDFKSYWYSESIEKVPAEDYLSFTDSNLVEDYHYFLSLPAHVSDLVAVKDPTDDDDVIPDNWDNILYASYTSKISDEFEDKTREIIMGDVFKNKNECLVSDEYAILNNLKVGDTIELSHGDNDTLKMMLKITGIYRDHTPHDAPYWMRYSGDRGIRDMVLDTKEPLYTNGLSRTTKDVRANEIYVSYETIKELPTFEFSGTHEINIYLKNAKDIDKYRKELYEKGLPNYYDVMLNKDIEFY